MSRLKGRLTGRPKYAHDCGKGLCTVLIHNYCTLCMLNHKIIAREQQKQRWMAFVSHWRTELDS